MKTKFTDEEIEAVSRFVKLSWFYLAGLGRFIFTGKAEWIEVERNATALRLKTKATLMEMNKEDK